MKQRRLISHTHIRERGFTAVELLACIVILLLLMGLYIMLVPVFVKERCKGCQSGCASNEKQIGLALLGYIQDYDLKFPPARSFALVGGKYYPQAWGVSYNAGTKADPIIVPSIAGSYIKNDRIFQCPKGPRPVPGGTIMDYMLNDLITTRPQTDLAGVASTVLVSEASGAFQSLGGPNVNSGTPGIANLKYGIGHAVTSTEATITGKAGAIGSSGTAAHWETSLYSDITRHSDGGNFLLADGHVKWFKVTENARGVTQTVYFPARLETATSASKGKLNANAPAISIGACAASYEPQPGGDMCGYAATFHLN